MRIALISVFGARDDERTKYEKFLYRLLEQREPHQNISHKEMPDYDTHVNFVRSKPYKEWFVIQDLYTFKFIGSIYVSKQDEIGLFFMKEHQGVGYGKIVLELIYEHFRKSIFIFKANISPLNSHSLAFFANNGFEHNNTLIDNKNNIIQYTYQIANPFYAGAPVA